MVVVGYDLPSSELAVKLAEQHQGLWAAVGVHPHDAAVVDDDALACLRELADSQGVVAIGETGLDYYRDLSSREAQESVFRRCLELAEGLRLPVIVHCRAKKGRWDAQERALEMLTCARPAKVIWHCFDGTREHAQRALKTGAVLSFGALFTYRPMEELRRVAAQVPSDRILLETDSPYLPPGRDRGSDNEPANLPVIAGQLARLRGETVAEVENVTTDNALRSFGLGGR
jgi:TatD DNase family protein